MAAPIQPIAIPGLIQMPTLNASTAQTGGFSQIFGAALSQVGQSSAAAQNAVNNYLSGGSQELHSTILATQKASIDLELLLQVRNKVVSAYDEIMKLQI